MEIICKGEPHLGGVACADPECKVHNHDERCWCGGIWRHFNHGRFVCDRCGKAAHLTELFRSLGLLMFGISVEIIDLGRPSGSDHSHADAGNAA